MVVLHSGTDGSRPGLQCRCTKHARKHNFYEATARKRVCAAIKAQQAADARTIVLETFPTMLENAIGQTALLYLLCQEFIELVRTILLSCSRVMFHCAVDKATTAGSIKSHEQLSVVN